MQNIKCLVEQTEWIYRDGGGKTANVVMKTKGQRIPLLYVQVKREHINVLNMYSESWRREGANAAGRVRKRYVGG